MHTTTACPIRAKGATVPSRSWRTSRARLHVHHIAWRGAAMMAAALITSVMSRPIHAGVQPLEYVQQTLQAGDRRVQVSVPAGYRLELLISGLSGPRLLTFAANGDLFIGSRGGSVYRVAPPYTEAQSLIELNDYPHSVALRRGELLIAQTSGLYRAAYEMGTPKVEAGALSLVAPLPGGGGHTSRTVATGPDGRIYVGLGITGNCSDEYLDESYEFDKRRGGILVLDESGAKPRWLTYASGLRNPVGFAWHPQTGDLFATNNGPDHQGFEQPPEYFSRVAAGSFHGMPWFQFDGERIRRDECIRAKPPRPITDVPAPVATFPARNAPMAVAFVPTGAMDERLHHDAVVALRGSWGTNPSGSWLGDPASRRPPKLVAVRFVEGQAQRVDDLITGFQLDDGERWARPVGVAVGPDGALYFTSDSGINGLFRLRLTTGR